MQTTSLPTCLQPNNSKTQPVQPIQNVQKFNVNYELLGCKQVGSEVVCKLKITSVGEDDDIFIYGLSNGETVIWDAETGSEYYPTTVKIGDKVGEAATYKKLIANFPVATEINFGNVNTKISNISKLVINGGTKAHQGDFYDRRFKIEMRNIVVSH